MQFRIKIYLLILTTCLLFSGVQVDGQVYHKARILTQRDGLSDNRVTCFLEDSRGYMWIGTRNGLNRYDGHAFHIYKPGAGNSIRNEVINDLEEDSRGRIWVATMEGVSIYDPASNHWEYILPNPDSITLSIPNPIVWNIEIDEQDIAWIVCDVFDLTAYHIRDQRFQFYHWKKFSNEDPYISAVGYHSIQRIVKANDREYWLATTRGLVKLDIVTGNFRLLGGGYNGDITDLQYDSKAGRVYLSNEKNELYCYEEKTNRYQSVSILREAYPSTRFDNSDEEDRWLASRSGLLKIRNNRNDALLEAYIPQLTGAQLPGIVNRIYTDKLKNRWVGTDNGFAIYSRSGRSSSFIPLVAINEPLGYNNMGVAYFDRISQQYIVCSVTPAGVYLVNTNTKKIKLINTDETGTPLQGCMTIKRDHADSLWLLTVNGIYRFHRGKGTFSLLQGSWEKDEVVYRDMYQDINGIYWIATLHKGLLLFDPGKNRFFLPEDTLINHLSTVTGFAYDKGSGNLVIATYGEGVFVHHLQTGKTNSYYPANNAPAYTNILMINSVAKDAKDNIWLASLSGGVFRYHPGMPFEKTFEQFDMKKGLPNNHVISLCSNQDSVLWLMSGNGIAAISMQGKNLYQFSGAEAFDFPAYGSDPRFPHPISYHAEKRELILAVAGGLIRYRESASDSIPSFPLKLSAVQINGLQVPFPQEKKYKAFKIKFRNNALVFEFAGLYYGPAPVKYEYKLQGYDPEWNANDGSFRVSYRNLPAGKYRFEVRAIDRYGKEITRSESILIRIVPPVWQQWWFICLAALLVIFSVAQVIRSLRRKLEAEQIVNAFATSLYGQNSTEDVFWDIAKNCISKIGFADCVVYQLDEKRKVLLQKAAFGPKNPQRREIANIIEIPLGSGIVGAVAATGKALMVNNTNRDKRYIVDDERRASELAVPVVVDHKIFAVIDSEHPKKGFFTRFHLRVMKRVAFICAERLSRLLTEERLRSKIARDLHDEMGSTLTSINIISKVAMEGKTDQEKGKPISRRSKTIPVA
ncbi:MAG: GAF domain-containing protein [Chitinophagaceae bacterium]|nr:GAF domain-containing protein [Chitinophagaceae bacterium]